jgi:hypothetical protein
MGNRNSSLIIKEEEEVKQEVGREAQQEVMQETQQEVKQEAQQEVGQKVGQEVEQEVKPEIEQEIKLETKRKFEQDHEQEVKQGLRRAFQQEVELDTSTSVVPEDVARPPHRVIKGSTQKRSITNHRKVHQRPISNPTAIRSSQDALTTHTLPVGAPVAHQPKLAESTPGQPQGLINDPANQRASMQAGGKVHNGSKPYVPLHPVTGLPLVRKRFPQDIAKDALKYMAEVGDINRKNEDLIITRACEKAKLEVRRDGMPGEIWWLERDIRDKQSEIRDAHFRKYVDTPPRLLCLLVVPALSYPIFKINVVLHLVMLPISRLTPAFLRSTPA